MVKVSLVRTKDENKNQPIAIGGRYDKIFEELGAEVITIGNLPDGYNINQECGSTHPQIIKKAVIKHRADFGISLDGDGDRVIIVDERGTILDGDDLLYIFCLLYTSDAADE